MLAGNESASFSLCQPGAALSLPREAARRRCAPPRPPPLPLAEAVLFALVKEVCLRRAQVDDLGTAIALRPQTRSRARKQYVSTAGEVCEGGCVRVRVWARGATYVLLLLRALLAVVGIGDARLATDDAATLIGAVVALVADTHEDARPHVGVADGALAVALFAQAANRCKARDMGGSGGRRRHMHFASAFEGAACAQMPGCFRHMIRSGWCFAMANPCGEARTLAKALARCSLARPRSSRGVSTTSQPYSRAFFNTQFSTSLSQSLWHSPLRNGSAL